MNLNKFIFAIPFILILIDCMIGKSNSIIGYAINESIRIFNKVENGYRNRFKTLRSMIASLFALIGVILLTLVGIRICALLMFYEEINPKVGFFENSYNYTIIVLSITIIYNTYVSIFRQLIHIYFNYLIRKR